MKEHLISTATIRILSPLLQTNGGKRYTQSFFCLMGAIYRSNSVLVLCTLLSKQKKARAKLPPLTRTDKHHPSIERRCHAYSTTNQAFQQRLSSLRMLRCYGYSLFYIFNYSSCMRILYKKLKSTVTCETTVTTPEI